MEELKEVIQDIPDSIILLDAESKIEEVNPATLELLGFKKEELVGKPFNLICRNFPQKEFAEKTLLRNCEAIYLKKNGEEIQVNLSISVKRDDTGNTKKIIYVARDIGEMKHIIEELTRAKDELETSYKELEESKDQLVRSEKLAFAGRMAASVAHEIRNPLNVVSMSIQRLQEELKKDDPRRKYLLAVNKNIDKLNYLITEFVNCARPPMLKMRPCDIHKVLNNVLTFIRDRCQKQKVKVIKNFTPKLPKIKIDEQHMRQAFLNIVLNALQAMPDRGELKIETRFEGDAVVIKFSDNGVGIPEEDIKKIFDPFFTTREKEGGMGLGLSVVYGIIGSHGGLIDIESKKGKGATFSVSLPIKKVKLGEIVGG